MLFSLSPLHFAPYNLWTVPSENWDDDFELGRGQRNDTLCVSASSSTFTEDWDNDSPHHGPAANQLLPLLIPLQVWAEPGDLSTLTKWPQSQAENWDVDFEDKANSPAAHLLPSSYCNKPHVITPSGSCQQHRLSHPNHESWDRSGVETVQLILKRMV